MNKTILVVDDDREFLSELEETLVSGGYDVITSNDGVSALEAVRSQRPDLILLDLRMKPMSGFELSDKLRGLTEAQDIPVIAMTGFYTEKEHSWLMNICGIGKCLKKPLEPVAVVSEIENALLQRDKLISRKYLKSPQNGV